MRATTTVPVGVHVQPGDEIANSRAEVHTVTAATHYGKGLAGVLLTERPSDIGTHLRYVLWVVSYGGEIRATMTTDDPAAVAAAYVSRVSAAVREVTA